MPLKLDEYKLADWTDDAVSPVYLGYVTSEGHWYIKKIDNTARTMRFAVGLSEYATAWSGKVTLDYYYLYEVF
jgi:hypothetical protein